MFSLTKEISIRKGGYCNNVNYKKLYIAMTQNKTYIGYKPKKENIVKLSEYVSKRKNNREEPTSSTQLTSLMKKQSPLKNKRF
jgi:hypothetical protein